MPTRVAVIDLGSNAVRFEVYELKEGLPELIHRHREVLRLGNGAFDHAALNPDILPRAYQLFAEFRLALDSLNVQAVRGVATSAFREASDGAHFLAEIHRRFAIDVQVITGEEEAILIARGILANEPDLDEQSLLIDIGGGSTELSLCRGRKILVSESLPIGAIRGHEAFLKTNPPAPDSEDTGVTGLARYVERTLTTASSKFSESGFTLVGSSGTARSVLALTDSVRRLCLDDLDEMANRLAPLTHVELCAIEGMEANRADVVLAGVITLRQVLLHFNATEIRISPYSLRHGLLAELLERGPR